MWREVQLRWHGAPRGVCAMSEVLGCCASTPRGAKCKPMQLPSGFLIGTYMSIASLAEKWVLEHCTHKCTGCRLFSKHLVLRSSFAPEYTAPLMTDFVGLPITPILMCTNYPNYMRSPQRVPLLIQIFAIRVFCEQSRRLFPETFCNT